MLTEYYSPFQLLLTRSKNLAQKLRLYTQRLINTRMGIIDSDPEPQNAENEIPWDDSEEDTTRTLLSLRDQDFPLVCTFDYFLRLLENTVGYATIICGSNSIGHDVAIPFTDFYY